MAKMRNAPHLVRYLSSEDIGIAIKRVPEEYRSRVREITTWNSSRGVRRLGYVTIRGRRDINMCVMLPPRLSLRAYILKGQSVKEFGAPVRGQWPPWAVRRYLLYDVLLHELGHLQIAIPKSKNMRRKFSAEKLAQDFSDHWRRKLFSTAFNHPDIVHKPPSEDENTFIPVWQQLNKDQRFDLVDLVLKAPHDRLPDISGFGQLEASHIQFLSRALCQ